LGLVPYAGDRLEGVLVERCDLVTIPNHIRKGPPLVGRFEKLIWKETPIPLGFAVAETIPLMLPRVSSGLKNDFAGRVTVYMTPGGLFSTTVAFPRRPVIGSVVCAFAKPRRLATRTEMTVGEYILRIDVAECMVQGAG
jgi:hypothetical protein